MLSNNALLRASIVETPEGEENIITLSHSEETYVQSDVKWVIDYVGPTGRPTPHGIVRNVSQKDFEKIITNNLEFKIQKNESNELVLHYIEKP
jgi:hypothetical protein